METHKHNGEKARAMFGANAEEIGTGRPSRSAVLTALRERDRAASELDIFTPPIHITVVVSFRLSPHRQDDWYSAWRGLADIAERLLYCHRFDLLRDRDDESRCVVISEWDNRAAFNHFVRRTNLLWLERAMGYSQCPAEFTFFEGIPEESVRHDAEMVVETVPLDTGRLLATR